MNPSSASAMHSTLSQVVSRWCCLDDGNDGDIINQTVLILDSLESDGRFVLGTLVSSLLSRPDLRTTVVQSNRHRTNKEHGAVADKDCIIQRNSNPHRILWLNCTTVTDQLTLAALQKFGSPKSAISAAHLPESSSSPLPEQSIADAALTIRSIPVLFRRMMMDSQAKGNEIDVESVVKLLYRHVKTWLHSGQQHRAVGDRGPADKDRKWVILDDASTLGVLVGERLAYGLILSLQSLSRKSSCSSEHAFGLVIRASNDYDIERAALVDPRSAHWFGGAVDENDDSIKDDECPWERQLVEMADTVVDVVPLASGYSREVHGRLIFTSKAAPAIGQDVYNYCLTDNQALVIRVVK